MHVQSTLPAQLLTVGTDCQNPSAPRLRTVDSSSRLYLIISLRWPMCVKPDRFCPCSLQIVCTWSGGPLVGWLPVWVWLAIYGVSESGPWNGGVWCGRVPFSAYGLYVAEMLDASASFFFRNGVTLASAKDASASWIWWCHPYTYVTLRLPINDAHICLTDPRLMNPYITF